MRLTFTFFAVVALLVLPFHAFAEPDQSPVPSITVNGQAELMVIPDEVLFTLTVKNLDKDLNLARRKTESDAKEVFALAESFKVPPQNVQTYYIHVDQRYE